MKKKLSLIAYFIFFFVALINVLNPIFQNISKFTEKFEPKKYEKKYNQSQYIIPQSKNPISDEELLSYAGYRYAQGINPVLINSDHPPLGKYFIGWVTLLTGNNRIVSILFAFGNFILIAGIIYLLTKSLLLSSLGVLFLSFDTMFIDQIVYSPILDIIQVFFLLLYFLFLFLWLEKERLWKVIVMGIMLGCMASVKMYFPVFVVLLSVGFGLFLLKKSLKIIVWSLLVTIIVAGLIYTLTYAKFFFYGNSLHSFLGAQKWIFLFWKNNSINNFQFIGDALTLILFNQWKVWWGDKLYIQFERWSILWPIFFLIGIIISLYILMKTVGLYFSIKTKPNFLYQSIVVLSVWIFFATIYLSLLPISPRYIMILFFPIYILIPLVIQLLTKSKLNF